MGKGHRDNFRARRKRGAAAFEKKASRRAPDKKRARCRVCGKWSRASKVVEGFCPICADRFQIMQKGASDA